MSGQDPDAVTCRGCGHGYDRHATPGGSCTSAVLPSSSPAQPCLCPGFRWIDPGGPAVGSYTDPPSRPT